MSRPTKQGLDYFPLDVDFFADDKIEYVSARFDEKGELITIKLLCMIYRNGFYTEWNEDKATIFAKRAGRNISPALVKDVVEELVKRGFFDRNIFNSFAILTSKGIQKRFLRAVIDRKDIEIISKYWLIDLPEDTQRTTFAVIHEDNSVKHKDNSIKHEGNTQTKINKTKIKKRKENPTDSMSNPSSADSFDYDEIIAAWNSLNLQSLTIIQGKRRDSVRARVKDFGIENIFKAIDNIKKSSFLLGQNNKNWTITFDWFVRPNNFPKVLEGNYLDDKTSSSTRAKKEFDPEDVSTWQL